MKHLIMGEGENKHVVLVSGETVYHVNDSNPNFGLILEKIEKGTFGDSDTHLLDRSEQVNRLFRSVSERVSVSGGVVYFDGDPVHSALTKHILRSLDEGTDDYVPLVAFWENIAANPSKKSRKHLMDWLMAKDFSITDSGEIVAYKGLREDFTSVHAGPAIVDGVEVDGHVPNKVGSVIEMARSEVDNDRDATCSYGLHAGTYEYAKWFSGGNIVVVHINPRDVVSVPQDHNAAKMRVCRYKVVRQAIEAVDSPVVYEDLEDDWVEAW